MTAVDTRSAIIETVRDYFEGWYDGDVARMERALHPGLAKRAPKGDSLDETTAAWMIDATARGAGSRNDPDQRRLEIAAVDVYDRIATVTVHGPIYVEYLHLVGAEDGWRIVNALWEPAP
jgi:Putative lumazine-binding